MVRALAAMGLLALGARAPMQCATRRPPEVAREETPPEALAGLAARFDDAGNAAARDETYRFLVERYPSSRYAERARDALRDAGR